MSTFTLPASSGWGKKPVHVDKLVLALVKALKVQNARTTTHNSPRLSRMKEAEKKTDEIFRKLQSFLKEHPEEIKLAKYHLSRNLGEAWWTVFEQTRLKPTGTISLDVSRKLVEEQILIQIVANQIAGVITFQNRNDLPVIRDTMIKDAGITDVRITSAICMRVAEILKEKKRLKDWKKAPKGQTLKEISADAPPPPTARERDYADRHRH